MISLGGSHHGEDRPGGKVGEKQIETAGDSWRIVSFIFSVARWRVGQVTAKSYLRKPHIQ